MCFEASGVVRETPSVERLACHGVVMGAVCNDVLRGDQRIQPGWIAQVAPVPSATTVSAVWMASCWLKTFHAQGSQNPVGGLKRFYNPRLGLMNQESVESQYT